MFSSKLAFVLTAVGAAVGLGNVFRFPYLAMKYGLSFVLVYLLFLCLLGLPLLLSEIAFGRGFAFKKPDRKTALLSRFCSFNSFFVFGYYTLLFAFVIMAAIGSLSGDFSALSALSEGSSSGGHAVNILFLIFAFAAALFCFGDAKRIGAISTVSVIISLLIIVSLALFRAFLFPESLEPLFRVDFSFFADINFWFDALSQVFFSLSVAIGVLTAYGALLKKGESIVLCGIYIAAIDLLVSLFAAVIYATVGGRVDGLFDSFSVYPKAFFELGAAGPFLCFLFYISLGFLCLDSVVSFLKSSVCFLYPKRLKKEETAATVLSLFAFCFALVLLLLGARDSISFVDGKITPTLILLGGLSLTIIFSKKEIFTSVKDELGLGRFSRIFRVLVCRIAPVFIIFLLAAQIFL